jgi:mannose/cellobiose epimerase-like protein (N-acyl-D-glucosamine 2-epimerase family)
MTASVDTDPVAAVTEARSMQRALLDWLVNDAYPLWATAGVDASTGAFVESLDEDGRPLAEPRRARVQARQVYAFAHAAELGWQGPAGGVGIRGIRYFMERYRRPDGLYRTLVAVDGAPLDDSVLLYDQAFALLGMASACKLSRALGEWEQRADALLHAVHRHLKRAGGGFDSGLIHRVPLLSNPHMHLFEACLAWRDLSANPVWRTLADDLGTLALTCFIDPAIGAVREVFDEAWKPVAEIAGRIVEPGHQFEWAWLLLRWRGQSYPEVRRAALGLIEIGERAGIHNGMAVDALLDDIAIHTSSARLWPQTERLKAAALAASLTGDNLHWARAVDAAKALRQYLATRTPGLWRDLLNADGTFLAGPAPASNFYHIVGAVLTITMAVRHAEVEGSKIPRAPRGPG